MTAVFDDHRNRDARRIGRRVTDEERVVTQLFVHLVLFVFLVLGDLENLRGSGLAGGLVFQAAGNAMRGAG